MSIDLVLDSRSIKHLGEALHMRVTFFAEMTDGLGGRFSDILTIGILAVKDSEGVSFKSRLAGVAELILVSCEILNELISVCGTALGTSDGVQVKLDTCDAKLTEKCVRKRDNGKVSRRALCTEHLGTKLEEFAAASRLRLLVTEAVDYVIILEGHRVGGASVFNDCTYNGCSAFRTKGENSTVAVGEGVHFLLYNVCCITDTSLEE